MVTRLGVWKALVALKSASTPVNNIAKEVVLHLAPIGHDLRGIHIWSEVNVLADGLSRVGFGEQVHGRLNTVPWQYMASRGWETWRVLGRIKADLVRAVAP